MFEILLYGGVGWLIGAFTPITLNRVRRKLLSGKFFGKLPDGAKDPTSA